MQTDTNTAETRALIANDIRVLVTQLNETTRKASEMGLRVEISNREVLDLPAVCKRAEITARIFAEVQ
jgi:hypothetical protein